MSVFSVMLLALILVQITFVFQQNWFGLGLSLIALLLIFLPSILEKKLSIDYPNLVITTVLIYLYLSALLGEYRNYFEQYWWWDLLMHMLYGLIVGSLGFLFVLELTHHRHESAKLSNSMMVVFAFSFAMAIGAIWEIVEYTLDTFLGTNLQLSSLTDTMRDLIADAVGALLISFLGLVYLEYPRKNLIEEFVEKQKQAKEEMDDAVDSV